MIKDLASLEGSNKQNQLISKNVKKSNYKIHQTAERLRKYCDVYKLQNLLPDCQHILHCCRLSM